MSGLEFFMPKWSGIRGLFGGGDLGGARLPSWSRGSLECTLLLLQSASVTGGYSGSAGDQAFVTGVPCVLVLCESRKSILVLDGGSG